jgi:hypothetical protein
MTVSVLPALTLNPAETPADPNTIWYHPAFCQLALPFASLPGSWHRQEGNLRLFMDLANPEQSVPSGWGLRRLLMHLCDRAVRTAGPVVELGPDATALVADLGLPATEAVLLELSTQVEHLVTAKLSIAYDQEPALAMFDARGQRHRPDAGWRPRLRLSSRFHASLMQHAIPLDRHIVATLAAEALALDAHGWIRHTLRHQPAGQTTTVPWPELLRRFGSPGQEYQAFRAAFEDALRMVFAADYTISLAADDEGITVGALHPATEGAEEVVQLPQDEPAAPAPPPVARPPRARHQPSPAPARTDSPTDTIPPSPGAPQPIGLRQHLTGLPGVVWLRRGTIGEPLVIGVTPGSRFEPDRMTLLMLEPLVMQVSGGLYEAEFTKVADWIMTNRDLIDRVWNDEIRTVEEASSRVRKAPASGWRG